MTLTLNFQGQVLNLLYISVKIGLIATNWKANISIELYASNVTIGFHLGHDLDLEFSWSNMGFAISQLKKVSTMKWKSHILIEFKASMTIEFDLGLERGGVRIYWIVARVTSDVGMPSTHLISDIDVLTKLHVKFFKSCPYLTGVPVAQLTGHIIWTWYSIGKLSFYDKNL